MEFKVEMIYPNRVQNEETSNDELILQLKLENTFDGNNCKELYHFVHPLMNGGIVRLLVDMNNLRSIDSAGIGVMINLAKLLRARRGEIAFSRVPFHIMKIFDLIRLQTFIQMYPTEASAIKFLNYSIR